MNRTYRVALTEVEAIQVADAMNQHRVNAKGLPEWVHDAFYDKIIERTTNGIRVTTPDGEQFARTHDWLIQLPNQTIQPVRASLFPLIFDPTPA